MPVNAASEELPSSVEPKRAKLEYRLLMTEFALDDSEKIVEICKPIYEEFRSDSNDSATVAKVLRSVKDLPPFCRFGGSLICVLHANNYGATNRCIVGTRLYLFIMSDWMRLLIYKSMNEFVQQKPTQHEVEQHIIPLPYDCQKILHSLGDKFGGHWTVVEAARDNNLTFVSDPAKYCTTYEIKINDKQFITAIQCARTELVAIFESKLSANGDLILQIIEQLAEEYFNSKNFNQFANELLDKVTTLDPFKNAKNPIRCSIYKGDRGFYGKADTYLYVQVGTYWLMLNEDRFGQPVEPYNVSDANDCLQSVADKGYFAMHSTSFIESTLVAKFPNLCWNSLTPKDDFNAYAIATRPPNLPLLEARGTKGERVFAWATATK